MNRQVGMDRGRRILGLMVLFLVITVVFSSFTAAQQTPIMVGISPLASKVADIPAEEAQELFINALMETNHFSIRPPDASGSHAGSAYVLEPTISEAKGKSNVLGMLKDAVTSNSPISLTVRVFDPRTNALLKSVTVKSTETKNAKVGLGDVKSLMGAFSSAKGEQEGKGEQQDGTAQLEERLGGLMQEAATRLATQLGGGAMGAGAPRTGSARMPLTR
jgi:hypothetical protein